jgi:hypothetical protein
MLKGARIAYVALAWAFVLGMVGQVFVIGLALFADPSYRGLHRDIGYVLSLVPIVILVVAAVARVGRRRLLWTLGLAVVVFVFPIFPVLRESLPFVAALHPVGALVGFWMAIVVARGASAALHESDPAATPSGATAG